MYLNKRTFLTNIYNLQSSFYTWEIKIYFLAIAT